MSQKRHQREDGTAFSNDKRSRRSHSFRRVVQEVIILQRLQNLMNPILEPLVRRVIKEEVDTALRKYSISMKRDCGKDARSSESMSFQLQFVNTLSLPVFTGSRIEGEGGSSIKVELIDILTGQVVSHGPGSSAKVEIVVLEGDFYGDDGDNWTLEEFTNNIVKEREGKKPLLTGDVTLNLNEGTGLLSDISFTDNSSWTRSRKFRLGARLIDNIGGIKTIEAISEAFVVRDHRGELYKKHHPPHLSDEVWRLEKIAKGGALHRRLSKGGIISVQDFLILLSLDPTRLRNILGSGMSSKKWEVMVEHARTCVIDKPLYLYNTSTSLQKEGVVFNAVGQVMGILSNDHFVESDKLSETEKTDAHQSVVSAFGDLEKVVPFEPSPNILTPSHAVSENQPSSNIPSDGCYHQDSNSDNINTSTYLQQDTGSEGSYHQDSSADNINSITYLQQDTGSPDFMQSLYSTGGWNGFDYSLNSIDPMEIRCDQPLSFPDKSIFDPDYMAYSALCELDGHCSPQNPDWGIQNDLYGAVNPFLHCPPVKKGWSLLVHVLRWRFSIKRIVAKKSPQKRFIGMFS